jgi:erythromycin esterase-like protein
MKSDYRSRPTIVTSETRDTHKGKLRKEWNIGQLARERFGMDKGYNIGFTTHNGSGKQT